MNIQNEIERIDDKTIRTTHYRERVLTNQEFYNEFAKLKMDKAELQQQLVHAHETTEVCRQRIEAIDKAIQDMEPHANIAKTMLNREKQIEEADKNV